MYTYFKAIDEHVLAAIYEHEEQQLLKFKNEFENLCLSISRLHGWGYIICIHRWADTADKCGDRPIDGYTATLQIDFTDNNGNVIELDEGVCSFFENITYIEFDSIRQKYCVFRNEKLADIRTAIKQFVCNLEKLK